MRLDEGWWIVAGPNGGYVAALMLRAILAHPDTRSPSTPGTGDPARPRGRSPCTSSARRRPATPSWP
ncbi:MAG: thioesterase family protein [Actinomycetota bacterium]|nr:thioesterase family protein [Actinomycetota bacterium]